MDKPVLAAGVGGIGGLAAASRSAPTPSKPSTRWAWAPGHAPALPTPTPRSCTARWAYQVDKIPTGEAFHQRWGKPCAVPHRVDVHRSLLDGAQEAGRVAFLTSTRVERIEHDADGVAVCDPARVTGHVVYRAVIGRMDFPEGPQWNAAGTCVGTNRHRVHCPLRGGAQYNGMVTFHSRNPEPWGVTNGSREGCRAASRASAPRPAS